MSWHGVPIRENVFANIATKNTFQALKKQQIANYLPTSISRIDIKEIHDRVVSISIWYEVNFLVTLQNHHYLPPCIQAIVKMLFWNGPTKTHLADVVISKFLLLKVVPWYRICLCENILTNLATKIHSKLWKKQHIANYLPTSKNWPIGNSLQSGINIYMVWSSLPCDAFRTITTYLPAFKPS